MALTIAGEVTGNRLTGLVSLMNKITLFTFERFIENWSGVFFLVFFFSFLFSYFGFVFVLLFCFRVLFVVGFVYLRLCFFVCLFVFGWVFFTGSYIHNSQVRNWRATNKTKQKDLYLIKKKYKTKIKYICDISRMSPLYKLFLVKLTKKTTKLFIHLTPTWRFNFKIQSPASFTFNMLIHSEFDSIASVSVFLRQIKNRCHLQ